MELAPGHQRPDRPGGNDPVSILVFVELAPGHTGRRGSFRVPSGFNPCFCGTRARTPNSRIMWPVESCFNPCFCGTRARTRVGNSTVCCGCVSILVFVELAPGRLALDRRDHVVMFQSLFLWNSRPDIQVALIESAGKLFQSLFLWNSRPDSGGFSSFSLFLYVKPAFSRLPSGMSGIY